MNKIKTAIIHWLGGVTKEELNSERATSYINGRRIEATVIKCEMRDLYGLSAEEWCDEAWNCVAAEVERYNKHKVRR